MVSGSDVVAAATNAPEGSNCSIFSARALRMATLRYMVGAWVRAAHSSQYERVRCSISSISSLSTRCTLSW